MNTLVNLVDERVKHQDFHHQLKRNEEYYYLRRDDSEGWANWFWDITRWVWFDEDRDGDIVSICTRPSEEKVLKAYHVRRGQRLSYKTRRKMQRVAKRAS